MQEKDLVQRVQEEPVKQNQGILYRLATYALKIRKAIRATQPEYYIEYHI